MLQDIYIHLGTLLHMHILPHTCTCMSMDSLWRHWSRRRFLPHCGLLLVVPRMSHDHPRCRSGGDHVSHQQRLLGAARNGHLGWGGGRWGGTVKCEYTVVSVVRRAQLHFYQLCLKEQVWSRYLTVRLKYIGKGTHSVCSNYNGSDYQSFIWTLYMNIGTFWVSPEGYLGSSYM